MPGEPHLLLVEFADGSTVEFRGPKWWLTLRYNAYRFVMYLRLRPFEVLREERFSNVSLAHKESTNGHA